MEPFVVASAIARHVTPALAPEILAPGVMVVVAGGCQSDHPLPDEAHHHAIIARRVVSQGLLNYRL
jgi:hypothetical protein